MKSLNEVLCCFLLIGAPTSLCAQCQPEWSGLNGGADWEVRGLAAMDEDGPGPQMKALFAGGGFSKLGGVTLDVCARWDGWGASGVGRFADVATGVEDLGSVHQPVDGLPSGLFATGAFLTVDDIEVNSIARWAHGEWFPLDGGLTFGPLEVLVISHEVAIFDADGEGARPAELYVGGRFLRAGGIPVSGIARWNGQSWSDVGGGVASADPNAWPMVYSLAVYDDGRGPALYAGGNFFYAEGLYAQNIARWDGEHWSQVGNDPYYGLTATVEALAVYDEDGDGPMRPALFAGGQFNYADGKHIPLIARWDGHEWTDVGNFQPPGSVKALTVWKGPDDDRENLYAGGLFNTMPDGSPVNKIARWNGKEWRKVGDGVTDFGGGTQVGAMAAFDEDGDGPNPGGLYVGGLFYRAGGVETHHIARWGCPLAPRCEADLDWSGSLDLFDFLEFVNLFNTENDRADCTADGQFDLFDFLCFVNAFNEGC